MLALSPARNSARGGCFDGESEFLATSSDFTINPEENFPVFTDQGDLLDIIDFDDLFGVAGDVLPDLEIDPEILAGDFSASSSSEKTDSQGETNKKGISEEVVSKRDEDETAMSEKMANYVDGDSNRKRKYSSSSGSSKNNSNEGKRKVKKVDWTPELHRRFVDAVEQLGLEKAVPSRILELMGVHCLTRHNVASHLQKYRSHRKHVLAREAEAANWTRKRHIYGLDSTGVNINGRNKNGWIAPAPTIGYAPPPPAAVASPTIHHHHFRPLHVWGHPTVNQSVIPHVFPKHLPPPSTAMATTPFWVSDNPYWPRVHNGTAPYFPTVATRFRAPPVAGIPQAMPPHHTVYKPDHGYGGSRSLVDLHPSKESVDAAIGDVLTRPWLPLPLGLKPPAFDGVMTELHRHGVSESTINPRGRKHLQRIFLSLPKAKLRSLSFALIRRRCRRRSPPPPYMAKKKKPKPVSSGASPVASIDSSVPSASSSATVPVSPDPAAASSPALEEGEISPFSASFHHLATAENFQDQNSSPIADLQEKGLEVLENPNAQTAATEPTVPVNPITEAAATESHVPVSTHPEKPLQSDKLQSPPVAPIASNQASESSQLQAQPTTVFKDQAKQWVDKVKTKARKLDPEGTPFTLESGEACVKIPNSVIEKNRKSWDSFIIGQFYEEAPARAKIHAIVNGMWSKHRRDIAVSKMNGNAFLFRVPCPNARRCILSQCLWQVDGQTLFVAKWSPGLKPEKPSLATVPVWLDFTGVPLQFFNEDALKEIAVLVGHPLCLHPTTSNLTNIEVARVYTVIDLRKPLPEAVNAQFETGEITRTTVSSPWLPSLCSHCKKVGHTISRFSLAPPTCATCRSVKHNTDACPRNSNHHRQGKEPIASQYPIVPNPAASRYKNNPGPRATGPAPSSHSKKGNSIWIRADPSALEDNGKRQASRSIPLLPAGVPRHDEGLKDFCVDLRSNLFTSGSKAPSTASSTSQSDSEDLSYDDDNPDIEGDKYIEVISKRKKKLSRALARARGPLNL
ncbi:unnamed protein product [Brassica oleracea var. botrytis]|uniref:(rape) hypothetical protein n=1 Tax=Brassica napus TaxID=3708 RepID=A0A816URJ1_BRANA|nr:unnamed protein product [Brassica napus]